ncbi:hypothetical protein [Kitasatospora cathayae]|uniref:RNA polymerase sigma factor 70 region 4 type 2 domain-containing protein n=1 Tax=Kitasatospora cathayae TaxID=3004092 RepID=A0ABY7QBN7_9ACTN|nr:hypothetical protein [Kitasatospora sp. HUAS 3-15]WBP89526.1 hypothetical protein O1G21_29255 [Kitasatospora sp. HUAS 3-15]
MASRRPPANRRDAHQVPVVERRRAAVKLRIEGKSWQEIADLLGYDSKGGACKDVSRALQKAVTDLALPLEEYRQLELDRLDAMQEALWPKVLDGETRAMDTALRLMDRRAKLLGLDAPTRTEGVLSLDVIDASIAQLTAQVDAARTQTGPAD